MNIKTYQTKFVMLSRLIVVVLTVVVLALINPYEVLGYSGASYFVKNVGYGVTNLTVFNPISSASINVPSTIDIDTSDTINFNCSCASSKKATCTLQRDGSVKTTHTYKSATEKYTWNVFDPSGKKFASGSATTKDSLTVYFNKIGDWKVTMYVAVDAVPSPKTVSVGATNWTSTTMPSVYFTKNAVSKVVHVVNTPPSISSVTWSDSSGDAKTVHCTNTNNYCRSIIKDKNGDSISAGGKVIYISTDDTAGSKTFSKFTSTAGARKYFACSNDGTHLKRRRYSYNWHASDGTETTYKSGNLYVENREPVIASKGIGISNPYDTSNITPWATVTDADNDKIKKLSFKILNNSNDEKVKSGIIAESYTEGTKKSYSSPFKLSAGNYTIYYYAYENWNNSNNSVYTKESLNFKVAKQHAPVISLYRQYNGSTVSSTWKHYENITGIKLYSSVYDADGETVNLKSTIYRLNTNTSSYEVYKSEFQHDDIPATATSSSSAKTRYRTADNFASGEYKIHWTASDQHGNKTQKDYLFTVYKEPSVTPPPVEPPVTPPTPPPEARSIMGTVYHSPKWDTRRVRFNRYYYNETADANITFSKYASLPLPRLRYSNVFWSGEVFMLRSIVSASPTKVSVEIEGTNYRTTLSRGSDGYSGQLWHRSMINKWGNRVPELLTFKFTATYSDNSVITDKKSVIVDNLCRFDDLHRLE